MIRNTRGAICYHKNVIVGFFGTLLFFGMKGVLLLLNIISQTRCHIHSYVSTPSNKIEQFCAQSENCVHDTIQVCGKMGEEKRTFLDLCDLLEYACDTNQIYLHVDDMEGCPQFKGPN